MANVAKMEKRVKLTDETRELLRKGIEDENLCEIIEENYLTYVSALRTGKYSSQEYINAVKYVSIKLMGGSNTEAYRAVFPERYEKIKEKAKGANCTQDRYVDGFVSMYNRTALVTKLMEQSLVPSYVLNAPLHQKVINELANMVFDAGVKGMARVKACEVLLNYTKMPDVIKHELDLSDTGIDTVANLKEAMASLSETIQRGMDKNVITLKQVAESEFVQEDD